MQEISVAELLRTTPHRFVQHQVDPAVAARAWVAGTAAVVENHPRWTGPAPGPQLVCLGPPDDLAGLMAQVAAARPVPWRFTVEAAAYDALPAAWAHDAATHWDWMLLREAPAEPTPDVVDVGGREDLVHLIDAGNPGSFARPGSPGVEVWLGVVEDGRLVAAGAVTRQHDGTGQLRGITVLPGHERRGLGRRVSTALTRRALAGRSGTASLGVYSDNAPAVHVYRQLGYRTAHTFRSGQPQRGPTPRRSTTAVAPSR
ncbi:Mycothiol acetyltransferase [Nocardioides dokdonensis FR1436]|uniref:Mycothiol acetyltransferase n=1 Tax=Nocardioides dokdonensis FR1436 TaxID=1300347 RepID=A0A1A9GEX7_9ACTN|nr:GNAT family N-acetyltransferase [Nocardioides dokdonensis]ANH36804.1 Mycothiol acetyltransferase [Nocardioides dokdonensis FR1436]